MFAIIQSGGRQVKVTPGAVIEVDRFDAKAGDEVDVPAGSAVAAVGTAARDELLAAEAQRALAAVTGSYMDFDFVYKHGDRL